MSLAARPAPVVATAAQWRSQSVFVGKIVRVGRLETGLTEFRLQVSEVILTLSPLPTDVVVSGALNVGDSALLTRSDPKVGDTAVFVCVKEGDAWQLPRRGVDFMPGKSAICPINTGDDRTVGDITQAISKAFDRAITAERAGNR